MPGMSFNSIMGVFTVFVTDPEVATDLTRIAGFGMLFMVRNGEV